MLCEMESRLDKDNDDERNVYCKNYRFTHTRVCRRNFKRFIHLRRKFIADHNE